MEFSEQLNAVRERVHRLETELAAVRNQLRELERQAGQHELPPLAPGSTFPLADPSGAPSGLTTTTTAKVAAAHSSVTKDSSPVEKLALFCSRFAGRNDVYALPWVSRKTGKKGWSPAVRGGFYTDAVTDADLLPLTDAVIERHLRGARDGDREFPVGLYPLQLDERTRLLACDFDDGSWREDAAAFVAACQRAGVDALAEISRSGEGAHVWIFFESPVLAASARAMGTALLRSAMSDRGAMSLSSYDRFFPSQDTLPQRSPGRMRLGNLIALPLQGERRRRGASVFANPLNWEPFADQFAALARTRPVREEHLSHYSGSTRLAAGPRDSLTTLEARPRRASIKAVARTHLVDEPIALRRDSMVHVPTVGLPGVVLSALKHAASIPNPEFYRKQAQRFSTFGTQRLVMSFEQDDTELRLPRGLLDETRAVLSDAGYDVSVQDETGQALASLDIQFTGELRPEQSEAVEAVLCHDTGLLVAPPGSGKTVIACALIAKRATPTAILVNSAELLQQWRARLTEFLSIDDKYIGQLGGGRHKRCGSVDLIMMQSIAHRRGDPAVLNEYGQIIVDECHTVAAAGLEAAIRAINVRTWVGLTATPYRADQMDGLITMQCGPIRHVIAAPVRSERRLVVHETTFSTEEVTTDHPSMAVVYNELAADEQRNTLIAEQVVNSAAEDRHCLVLVNRLGHLETLATMIRAGTDVPVVTMHGRLATVERRAQRERIVELDASGRPFVLVAMDKVAGEGMDLPTLDTLFLAMPVKFKGRIIQLIGRITRGQIDTGHATTGHVRTVHDFRDSAVPWLERMYQHRRRVMLKEGLVAASAQPLGE